MTVFVFGQYSYSKTKCIVKCSRSILFHFKRLAAWCNDLPLTSVNPGSNPLSDQRLPAWIEAFSLYSLITWLYPCKGFSFLPDFILPSSSLTLDMKSRPRGTAPITLKDPRRFHT